jgi:hypothetical protein
MADTPNNVDLRISVTHKSQPLHIPFRLRGDMFRRFSKREKTRDKTEVVGRWKNGSINWTSETLAVEHFKSLVVPPRPQPPQSPQASQRPQRPERPQRPHSSDGITSERPKSEPPKLVVVIPESSQKLFASVPYLDSKEEEVAVSQSAKAQPSLSQRTTGVSQFLHAQPKPIQACSSDSSNSGDDENLEHSESSSLRTSITSLDSLAIAADNKFASSSTPPQDSPEDFSGEHDPFSELITVGRSPSVQRAHRQSLLSGSFERLRPLPEANEEAPPSPTLSEAERDLLIAVQDKPLPALPEFDEEDEDEFPIFPLRTSSPKLKTRMSDLQELNSYAFIEEEEAPPNNSELQVDRNASVRSALSLIMEEEERFIPTTDAEHVIYNILRNTNTLDDLFNMSMINRGFYRVFKSCEVELMETTLRTMSPPAWELIMTQAPWSAADDGADSPSYTGTTFYECYLRDSYIMAGIKSIILTRCQSILRPETTRLLMLEHNPCETNKVDDALYRIWTFCHLFGCEKAREDDVTGQVDWLRGGIEAQRTSPSATFSSTRPFSELNPIVGSQYYGQGNPNGLSAEQLFDIDELWNCLRAISQSVVGRTDQARQFGVFDNTDIRGGDIDGEEVMLEEWHSYLLTLGLAVIIEISDAPTSILAFTVARRHKWTTWFAPAKGTSRNQFLRDAVSRLYEERVIQAYSPRVSVSVTQNMKELRRQRGEELANELRQRRKNLKSQLPYGPERPMSRAYTIIDRLASPTPTPTSAHSESPMSDVHPAFRAEPNQQQMGSHSPVSLPTPPIPQLPASYSPVSFISSSSPVQAQDSQSQVSFPHSSQTSLLYAPPSNRPTPAVLPQTLYAPASHSSASPGLYPPASHTSPLVTYFPTASHRPAPSPPTPTQSSFAGSPYKANAPGPLSPTGKSRAPPSPAPPSPAGSQNSSSSSRRHSSQRKSSSHAKPSRRASRGSREHPPGYQPGRQHPLQIAIESSDSSMCSPEKAIFRIVEMGFTAEDAKAALKLTDTGVGLRVDRAIEYLLRQAEPGNGNATSGSSGARMF